MTTLRSLTADGFVRPATTAFGPIPTQQWLLIADLRVDESYQREIGVTGRATIRRIVEEFRWSKFAPVVVAALEGGLYAIVDGQHRTIAALALGIEKVPCFITLADQVEQAAAFAAINGNTTAIHATQLFHAKVAAGDPLAVKVAEICASAGVTVLRSPRQANRLKPGETLAIGALMRSAANDEAGVLAIALRCITKTGDGNAGLLRSAIITAFAEVLNFQAAWRANEDALLDALDDFPFANAWSESAVGEPGDGGTATGRYVVQIHQHLRARMSKGVMW